MPEQIHFWFVPLQKVAKTDGAVMTQYHMKALEKIGLLKMDFLGLANLTNIFDPSVIG